MITLWYPGYGSLIPNPKEEGGGHGKKHNSVSKRSKLARIFSHFGTGEQYLEALFRWRWPQGFFCPNFGHVGYYESKM
jgi:hypothetical protein